ncbi:hypothetical protein K402DRAFT_430398 [Aulographum hederae CBS 113979]|uniref:Uncharacterized protein n=1 Tax=Aulographum hederae CBS 113979 TaxID=1176131 RepID=A0A6G1HG19_9PEZI|nr:hypothetical protein K402DRAFT_430398 [Aulographum hederae CBS 113979]
MYMYSDAHQSRRASSGEKENKEERNWTKTYGKKSNTALYLRGTSTGELRPAPRPAILATNIFWLWVRSTLQALAEAELLCLMPLRTARPTTGSSEPCCYAVLPAVEHDMNRSAGDSQLINRSSSSTLLTPWRERASTCDIIERRNNQTPVPAPSSLLVLLSIMAMPSYGCPRPHPVPSLSAPTPSVGWQLVPSQWTLELMMEMQEVWSRRQAELSNPLIGQSVYRKRWGFFHDAAGGPSPRIHRT